MPCGAEALLVRLRLLGSSTNCLRVVLLPNGSLGGLSHKNDAAGQEEGLRAAQLEASGLDYRSSGILMRRLANFRIVRRARSAWHYQCFSCRDSCTVVGTLFSSAF